MMVNIPPIIITAQMKTNRRVLHAQKEKVRVSFARSYELHPGSTHEVPHRPVYRVVFAALSE